MIEVVSVEEIVVDFEDRKQFTQSLTPSSDGVLTFMVFFSIVTAGEVDTNVCKPKLFIE